MITDGLLMLFVGVIEWAYGLLPAWDVVANFRNSMLVDGSGWTPQGGLVQGAENASIFDYILVSMWQMNKFLPVDHLVAALSMVVVFWGAVLSFRIGRWMLGLIRGAGGN